MPELSLDIDLRFDALSAIMAVLVLGVGALVLLYCAEYFHHHDGHAEQRLPSFAAELVAFAGAMFGLVVSDNMLLLYVFWELTTVLSFLLVGHYAERATSRRAAMQALLVTTAGGLAMLVGIIVLGRPRQAPTCCPSWSPTRRPERSRASAVALLLVGARQQVRAGATALLAARRNGRPDAGQRVPARRRDGQGRRLPRRAADPRFRRRAALAAHGRDPRRRHLLLAGWRAVREYDLKLILAFGTVSQLGFITLLVGAGGGNLMLAGLALLFAHALFKAALFMVVGIIDHSTGTRDIRRLAWLGHECRPLFVIAAFATASMAAVPPFLGFVAKEADFETLAHSASLGAAAPFVLAAVVLASVFTTIYSLRFLWGAFARKGRTEPSSLVAHMHRPSSSFLVAPAILAAASLALGIVPDWLDDVLDDYADTMPGGRLLPARAVAWRRPGAGAVGGGARRRRRCLRAAKPVAPHQDRLAPAGQRRPRIRRRRCGLLTWCR